MKPTLVVEYRQRRRRNKFQWPTKFLCYIQTQKALHPPPPHPILPNLDDTIEKCIGSIGVAQLIQAFIVSFAWVFDAQQTFISVFTDASPSWHCVDAGDIQCSSTADYCSLVDGTWDWDQPARTSTVSEWGLECYGSSISGIPASAFFVGCLVGGLVLATLGDSILGRKKMLWSTSLAMSLAGVLTAFSPNVWIYTALRFVTGFARATIGTSALVLSTEIVGKKWRGQVSIIGFFLFTLGFLSLPAIAYLTEGSSWRMLYIWTSLPGLCYSLIICFLVHESPRWLLVRGRRDEAIKTLKTLASSNGRSLTSSFFNLVIADDVGEDGGGVDLYSALKALMESNWASRRLAAVMMVGFGVGLVYYGMPLSLGNLGFNLYLSVTFNALSELPSSLATFFFIDIANRRSALLISTLSSGATSIACMFIHNSTAQMVAEVAAFFGTCTSFNILLIYTLELFPTCVRNSAVAMARQALVFGGVFAPMLISAGRSGGRDGSLSFGVFGLVIGCCGLFAVCLPETRGSGIYDTMEEQEYKESSVVECE